ncbi:14951_t:CDS:2 [Rhizophagus irregularis]|nr:14951_t:CDS:2 [Rhizophagus irregularis]
MSILYRDILYPIFEELQYDKKSLASCLRVNKTWCEIVIPILWRNPWEHLTLRRKKLLLNVIISHLSDGARTSINQHFGFYTNSYKRPLFNYISFCRHLNLGVIENVMNAYIQYEEFRNDILRLFINENAEYTHLYMPNYRDYHLFPGAEQCFSEIKFLRCIGKVKDNTLSMLTRTCKSIKELKFYTYGNDYNCGIAKLIENQKGLFSVNFLNDFYDGGSSRKIIENSLIKHADTIQYFSICEQPETKVLTSLVNLRILELISANPYIELRWDNIKDLTLPSLHTLIASSIPINCLINLIERSGRKLTKIYYHHNRSVIDNKEIIQAIYQNCPNLISSFPWDNLFNILAKSSPPSLFEFVFKFTNDNPKLESLKLFFDNWEGRHPISLKFKKESYHYDESGYDGLIDLIEKYKKKGVVKKFIHYDYDEDLDFLEIYKAKKAINNPESVGNIPENVVNNPENIVKNSESKATSILSRFKKIFFN